MKVEQLEPQVTEKLRRNLDQNCTKVLVVKKEQSLSSYDVYFGIKGKYKGLSIIEKDSEGEFYYYGVFQSIKDWENRPRNLESLRCVGRIFASLLADPQSVYNVHEPKRYTLASLGTGVSTRSMGRKVYALA